MNQIAINTFVPRLPTHPQRRSVAFLPLRARAKELVVRPQALALALALPPAAAVMTPLVGTAHFLLANPLMQLSLAGMAACTAVELAKKNLPASPKKGVDWAPIGVALVGAGVPMALLLATRAGLNALGVPPSAITADMVRETGCAALAGLQLAFFGTGVQAQFHDGSLDELLAPALRRAVAGVVLAPVAYQLAMQYAAAARVARVIPAVVMACVGALRLGTGVLPDIGGLVRGRRGYN